MGNSESYCSAPSMFDNNTNIFGINQSSQSNLSMKTINLPKSSQPEIESLTKSELENEIKEANKPPIPSFKKSSVQTTPNFSNPLNAPVDKMTGGNSMYRNNLNDPNFYEKPDINELNEVLQQLGQMNGGGNNEIMPIRERYNRYDVFKTIHKIEDNLQGGADISDVANSGVNNSNNKAMDHIKNLIFEQLRNLEKNKQNGSGGCGCGSSKPNQEPVSTGGYMDSSSDSSSYSSDDSMTPDSSSSTDSSSGDYGKSKKTSKLSKKSKKSRSSRTNRTNRFADSESSNFIVSASQVGGSEDSSSSSSSKESSSSSNSSSSEGIKKSTSNGNFDDESEEGLSVFPFNSSDVNSISSRKNFRMLRRKI